MRNNRILNLLFLTFFLFTLSAVFTSRNIFGAEPTTVTVERLDKEQMVGMIKPTLEKYLTNHPDPQVRIWSMVLLNNIDKVEEEQISSLPVMVSQLGNKDENIRQIALNSIRFALDLDEEEWKGIMGTVFRTTAKTTKYPEAKKLAIRALGVLQDLDEQKLNSLILLFDLAADDDADIRSVANEMINSILTESASGSGGGGVAGP